MGTTEARDDPDLRRGDLVARGAAMARAACRPVARAGDDALRVADVSAAAGPCSVRQLVALCRLAAACDPRMAPAPDASAVPEAVEAGLLGRWRHDAGRFSWDVVEVAPHVGRTACPTDVAEATRGMLAVMPGLGRHVFDAVVELATTDPAYAAMLLASPAAAVARTEPGF